MAHVEELERLAPLHGATGVVPIGDYLVPVAIMDEDWKAAGLGDEVDPEHEVARLAVRIAAEDPEAETTEVGGRPHRLARLAHILRAKKGNEPS